MDHTGRRGGHFARLLDADRYTALTVELTGGGIGADAMIRGFEIAAVNEAGFI